MIRYIIGLITLVFIGLSSYFFIFSSNDIGQSKTNFITNEKTPLHNKELKHKKNVPLKKVYVKKNEVLSLEIPKYLPNKNKSSNTLISENELEKIEKNFIISSKSQHKIVGENLEITNISRSKKNFSSKEVMTEKELDSIESGMSIPVSHYKTNIDLEDENL